MKASQKPIVYLDNSDFVRLYKENLPDNLKSVRDYLLEKVESGTIIIPNSYPLMVEFIQDFSEEHKEDRLKRARFIKQLCGDYAFKYIPKNDAAQCLNGNGVWTPEIPPVIDKIIKGISCAWQKVPHLARFARDMLHPGKRIRLAKSHGELFTIKMTPEEAEANPLLSKLVERDYIRKFLLKTITRKEIDREIEVILNDPESYVERVHDYDPLLTKAMNRMHELSNTINNNLINLQKDLEPQKAKLEQLTVQKKNLLESKLPYEYKKEVKRLHNDLVATFDTKGLSTKYFTKLQGEVPQYFFDVFDAYLHGQLGPSPRAWKKSDMGDVFHALYIPHSNLWRGDKAFCNLLIENDVRFCDRIVPKLLDLPQRIEELLECSTIK